MWVFGSSDVPRENSTKDRRPGGEATNRKPANFISTDANIGRNVKIWHFAYVGSGTVIGDDVIIGSLAHIDYNVRIGDGTRIEGSVYIPPLTRIGKDVFIGPAAVFTNDPYPVGARMVGVTVEDGAIICGGAVIKAGVRIGEKSVVAMGAIVTKDVRPGVVVMGVPAREVYSREEYDSRKRAWESGVDESRQHPSQASPRPRGRLGRQSG
jgi:UDP-3-O-[3-hydroxymyristoyl] glucosamine N-acyltransferase